MDLALNNQQTLICPKTQTNIFVYASIFRVVPVDGLCHQFEFQMRIYFQFQTNPLMEGMKPLILHLWV